MRQLNKGVRVLSDFDPAMGEIEKVHKSKRGEVVVKLFPDRVVKRDAGCLLIAGNKGEATDSKTFDRGDTLRCKAYRIPLFPHDLHRRSGSVIMQKWYKNQRTPGGTSHMVKAEYDLYAIVIDEILVFKSHEDLEMTAYFPDTAGDADGTSLCRLDND